MERLTKRTQSGVAYMAISDTLPKKDQEIEGSKLILEGIYAIFQKLAAYEDTDMIPADIKNMEKNYIELQKKFSKAMIELEEYRDLEEQGRLIKLPCKPEETLYGIILNELKEYKVFAINIGIRKHGNSCIVLANNHRNAVVDFELIDFGKTVFLTKQEAEQELKGAENEDI